MTKPQSDLAFASAAEMGRSLQQGTIRSVELVEGALARISKHDGELHAFVEVYTDSARAQARAADLRWQSGTPRSLLDGVPFAVKDLFDVSGHVTACGSKALDARVAEKTSNAVRRLMDGGMVLLGKTHTVEFAFGAWGTNPVCGTPVNPRDQACARVPGGSSSGSGVAVAAGFVPVALGTDTGGSVRNPAALCGTLGLKPSVGRIGRGGLVPLASSLDAIGPLVRSVEDAALILDLLQGEDPEDPATFGLCDCDPLSDLESGIDGLRLRVPAVPDLAAVSDEVLEQFRAALARFEALGAIIEPRAMPRAPDFYKARAGRIMAIESWNRLRAHVEKPDSRVHPVIRGRILAGRNVTADAYLDAISERAWLQSEFATYLDGADAFLTPTVPITAPPIEGIDETITPLGTFTRMVNLLDLSAISVPAGAPSGLPAALQIVVRRLDEPRALRIARALEVARGGLFKPPAGYI